MGDRILVVDDESGPREGLRRLLEAWGYDSEAASSADQALARIDRDPPSAVITDLVMPGMDGLEFVRRLKEHYGIPVIVFAVREGSSPLARVPSCPPLLIHPEPLLHATPFTTRRAACPQGGYG